MALYKKINPLNSEKIAKEVFSILNSNTVAQHYVGNCVISDGEQTFELYFIQRFNTSNNSYRFSMNEFSLPQVTKPQLEPIKLSYIDTYEWYYTKKIYDFYKSQFNSSTGLLNPDYKKLSICLRIGKHEQQFSKCAISKPLESPFQSDIGLLVFEVDFTFMSLTENYY